MRPIPPQMPARGQLQSLSLSIADALRENPGPWASELRSTLKTLLLTEVRLAEIAKDRAATNQPCTAVEAECLANPHNWFYEQETEISCVKDDHDGPGVQFGFGREVVFVDSQGRRFATGRYWLSRNHRSTLFEDRLVVLQAADAWLAGAGLALGPQLQDTFRRQLQEAVAAVLL